MTPLALGMPSGFEWIIVAIIGLLIFGKRLPEVGKSLGKGIVEFKKGLKGVEDDISQVDDQPAAPSRPQIATPASTAAPQHKFDPYTGKPLTADVVSPVVTVENASTTAHANEVSASHQ